MYLFFFTPTCTDVHMYVCVVHECTYYIYTYTRVTPCINIKWICIFYLFICICVVYCCGTGCLGVCVWTPINLSVLKIYSANTFPFATSFFIQRINNASFGFRPTPTHMASCKTQLIHVTLRVLVPTRRLSITSTDFDTQWCIRRIRCKGSIAVNTPAWWMDRGLFHWRCMVHSRCIGRNAGIVTVAVAVVSGWVMERSKSWFQRRSFGCCHV